MKSRIYLILFLVIIIGQMAVIGLMLSKVMNIKNQDRIAYLSCRAVDPYDPLRGRFVVVSASQNYVFVPTPKKQDSQKIKKLEGQKIFCVLNEKADHGLFEDITEISTNKPDTDALYIEAMVWMVSEKGKRSAVYFRLPAFKYYIQENYAQKADEILRNSAYDPKIVLQFDKNMNYIVKDILIDKKPLEDFIRLHLTNK
jgi:uncharacterized membrane-anchored protein